MRSFTGDAITNSSTILPAYIVDDQVAAEIAINSSTMTNFTTQSFIQLSNDSRLFVDGEPYSFEDVESLDEDQRQRRRLRSARNEINLLNADHEHISTMITTVFSTARNYINNQTVRANVVRYLTSKMRSLGLVTGNQIFHPEEFSPLVRIKKTFYKNECDSQLSFMTIYFLFASLVREIPQTELISSEFSLASFGEQKTTKFWSSAHIGTQCRIQAEWMIMAVA